MPSPAGLQMMTIGREERDVRPGGDNSVRSCRSYSRAKIGPGTSAGEFSMALSLQGEGPGVLAGWPGGPLREAK